MTYLKLFENLLSMLRPSNTQKQKIFSGLCSKKKFFGISVFLSVFYLEIRDPKHSFANNKVSSIQEVQKEIQSTLSAQNPKDILLIVGLDMTLTQPGHPALYPKVFYKYQSIYNDLMGALPSPVQELPLTVALTGLPQNIIEPAMVHWIQGLQKAGIKTITISGSLTGPLGSLVRVEAFRYLALKGKGIDFSNSFPQKDLVFREFPAYRGQYPTFYRGLLCTNGFNNNPRYGYSNETYGFNGLNQGVVLVHLLRTLSWTPKTVIFIDATQKNLTDVRWALDAFNPHINFFGFLYEGANKISDQKYTAQAFQAFWSSLTKFALMEFKADSGAMEKSLGVLKESPRDEEKELEDLAGRL
jgi:hypothetical protein